MAMKYGADERGSPIWECLPVDISHQNSATNSMDGVSCGIGTGGLQDMIREGLGV